MYIMVDNHFRTYVHYIHNGIICNMRPPTRRGISCVKHINNTVYNGGELFYTCLYYKPTMCNKRISYSDGKIAYIIYIYI